ncbi:glycine cleavage T C-terminal barrel domain-containing protein [Pararhodospirillum photometricum]|uniref:Aminomethyltransferase n=1 Tax=Pararhodospirillum photometricum DSM 122 TaxID=1150469 RepID=H6SLR5_PARPM|nr:glycine cleavage T C-terminal barrel domain-containing protein [Pararhodospirillum photometricum]CCG08930.1 Aminomethyltransferase [Pararhodospirillum photometricum DSM 122]
MSASRLPPPFGTLVDRERPVTFRFEGRPVHGLAGDTIASALAAQGQWMLSRSFKYHRPRGMVSAAGLEANTLVQVGVEPNVYADRRPITPDLAVTAVNTFGGLALDAGRLIGLLSRFMPVGFYYRAFFKPKGSWKLWEPVIRHLAGLGRIDPKTPHGVYDKAYLFADVAVVGGGPAGLAAALAAAEAGAEVLLVEENPVLGGALTYARAAGDAGLVDRVRAHPGITVLTEATCQGLFADHWLSVTQGNRLNKVRAKAVVIASGAHEVPAVFRGNDLPGILLGSAVQRLMRLWAVRPGTRAVILAANDDAYGVALDLLDAGVSVAAIADLRPDPGAGAWVEDVRARGIPLHPGTTIAEAEGRNARVAAVRLAPVTGPGRFGPAGPPLACDLVAVSVGYGPLTQLLTQGGAQVLPDPDTFMPRVKATPAGLYAAGSVNGVWAPAAVERDGARAGRAAAAHTGFAVTVPDAVAPDDAGLTWPHPVFPHPEGKEFIDFDEDLQVHDIVEAAALGWDHIQLLKRFSTAGMGPTQGKLTNALVQGLLGRVTGTSAPTVGTVTVRPPITGEKIGHLAGRGFDLKRLTPLHHRHQALGATMMVAGTWMRPAHYGPDLATAIPAEVRAARTDAALIDVSTLGKLEVRGPDAARFLERIYTWTYEKLAVGRVRYALMLDETGAIIDDGVAARLHEQHFYVTATTGGVDRVYRLMTFFNAQWRLRVDIAQVTAAFAGLSLLGPRSRALLAEGGTDIDLAPEAFPYLGVRTGTVAGIPARVMRLGFGGELGYEIHVPSSQGAALWDALAARGARPVGVEAQRVLRLEKGHIIVGQDTDSLTHPLEADMTWAVGRKKADFLGKAALEALEARPQTRRLVGFELAPDAPVIPKENHLVIEDGALAGRVTSIALSPTLGKVIGLAFVPPERATPGTAFTIRAEGGVLVSATVVAPPFYDPDNARQEM